MTTGVSCLDAMMVAVIAALRAHSGFMTACPGNVFDGVPLGVRYPYAWVTMREDPAQMETFGRMGFEVEISLRAYSLHEGAQELDAIMAAASPALHHQTLTVSGFVMRHLHYLGAAPLPAVMVDNKRVVQKIGRFRALVQAS